MTGYATAVLDNGLRRYEVAFVAARRACEHEDLGLFGWCFVELIEAGARSGEYEAAAEALHRLEERTLASETDWTRGIVARSRALLADDRVAEDLYREAIERLENTRIVVHLAHGRLIYGEWLRRCNRRVDARAQLRTAHEMLTRMGADTFAERARRELLATGEKVRKRSVTLGDALTAQEAQIARMAGEGLSNPESPRSCSSARTRSNGTCGRCSRSSASPRAGSSAARPRRPERPGLLNTWVMAHGPTGTTTDFPGFDRRASRRSWTHQSLGKP